MMQNLTALGRIKGMPFHVALGKKHGARHEETLCANHVGLLAVGHGVTEDFPLVRGRISGCQKMDVAISDGSLRGIQSVSWKEDGLSLRSDNM